MNKEILVELLIDTYLLYAEYLHFGYLCIRVKIYCHIEPCSEIEIQTR